jgi:CHASE3 domain sensor protein
MSGKFKLLIGVGVGYVLGARAGRERYDQIMGKAQSLWQDPRTQNKVSKARQVAQERAGQAAGTVQGVVQDKAHQVTDAVRERTGSDSAES